jgi:SAM-dependent methyltransferase
LSNRTPRERYVDAARAQDYEAAEQAADDWLTEQPDDRTARVVVAECRMRRNALDGAEPILRGLVEGDESDLRATQALATLLYRRQNFAPALALAETVLAARPDDPGVATLISRIRELKAREELFADRPYMAAYQQHMDDMVRDDPQAAIGSLWEEVGRLQIDYLVKHGLQHGHRLFDLGCGTLRAGRHLIRYLDTGCYTGMDMSTEAIASAGMLVRDEGLADKIPVLMRNAAGDLTFDELDGKRFDIVLAQSVFTHLLEPHIDECFQHIHRVLVPGGRFFFTYAEAPEFTRRSVKDFAYPLDFFQRLGAPHGLQVEGRNDYDHPRAQRMAVATMGEA